MIASVPIALDCHNKRNDPFIPHERMPTARYALVSSTITIALRDRPFSLQKTEGDRQIDIQTRNHSQSLLSADGQRKVQDSELYIWVTQPTGQIEFRRISLKGLAEEETLFPLQRCKILRETT